MKKIKRQTADLALNRAVQLLFFLLAPDIYATAFNGVKYLAIQIGNAAVIQCTPFVAVLITVLVYTFLFGRFFCLFLCPMGAVFALMPVLPLFQMKRDPARCVGKCHQCEGRCPTGYFVSGGEDKVFLGRNEGAGECIQCNRCASGCPVSNAGPGNPKKIRGNEWYAILIKAALLLAAVKLVVQYVS